MKQIVTHTIFNLKDIHAYNAETQFISECFFSDEIKYEFTSIKA